MAAIYITSDTDGAGKTALACALALGLQQLGKRVALFKPLTDKAEANGDVDLFAKVLGPSAGPKLTPLSVQRQALEQGLAATNPNLLSRARESYHEAARDQDVVIVHGLTSLTPEGKPLAVSRELVALGGTDASVLAVLGYRPGIDLAQQAGRLKELFGAALKGVVINKVRQYKLREVREQAAPKIQSAGVSVLAIVPEDRRMLAVTVAELVEQVGGEFLLGEEKKGLPVEHIMIGGLILDWGVHYFRLREDKAVIVRGDRPDIHMAVMKTPTSCLVLTGGHKSVQYVQREAETAGVPLVQAKTDTPATAAALDGLMERSTVHHLFKVERFWDMLKDQVSGEALEALVSGR